MSTVQQYEQLQKIPVSDPTSQQPPPNEEPQPPSRGRRSGIIIKSFLLFILVVGVVSFVLLLVLHNSVTVNVEYASLRAFNLSSPGNSLRYNLTVVLSLRNPSRTDNVYYSDVETSAFYNGVRFQWAPFNPIYMLRKSTTMLKADMVGATSVDLGASGAELYSQQRRAGAFDVEVRLQGRVRYKFGKTKSRTTWLRYKCWLPGLRLGDSTHAYVRTRCKTY